MWNAAEDRKQGGQKRDDLLPFLSHPYCYFSKVIWSLKEKGRKKWTRRNSRKGESHGKRGVQNETGEGGVASDDQKEKICFSKRETKL